MRGASAITPGAGAGATVAAGSAAVYFAVGNAGPAMQHGITGDDTRAPLASVRICLQHGFVAAPRHASAMDDWHANADAGCRPARLNDSAKISKARIGQIESGNIAAQPQRQYTPPHSQPHVMPVTGPCVRLHHPNDRSKSSTDADDSTDARACRPRAPPPNLADTVDPGAFKPGKPAPMRLAHRPNPAAGTALCRLRDQDS